MSHPIRKAPTLPENIRIGWKGLTVTSTLAYYDAEIIIVVRIFIVRALREQYDKHYYGRIYAKAFQ
jgi:hypothetical protein